MYTISCRTYIGIAIDSFHVTLTKTNNATEILGIVGIPPPNPCNVQRNGGEFGVLAPQVIARQQVDIVEDEDIVFGNGCVGTSAGAGGGGGSMVATFIFACDVKTNIEQFASIEFTVIIGLLNDVNVIVGNGTLLKLLLQEGVHVRYEFG